LFDKVDAPNFDAVIIENKEDIWPSFKEFLSRERVQEAVG
jgi:uncharacterized sporulation protein YeaH/YhbH (DUF444 family)